MDELLQALAQMGLTPEQQKAMLMQLMSQSTGGDPFMMGSGYDVKDANKLVDYSKDYNTILADNMTSAGTGMGAYGGFNEIGYGAFDPIVTRTPVEAPDRGLLDRYSQRPTTDIGGWIADQIANQGMTAFEVVGLINNTLNSDPTALPPEAASFREKLLQIVPQYTDDLSGETRYDMGGVEKLATTLEEQSVAQPIPGAMQDPETGAWYTEQSEDSPQTEWYRKQGLPLPTMEYTLDDFTQEGAAYGQGADLLRQQYANTDLKGLDEAQASAYETMLNPPQNRQASGFRGQADQIGAAMNKLFREVPAAVQPQVQQEPIPYTGSDLTPDLKAQLAPDLSNIADIYAQRGGNLAQQGSSSNDIMQSYMDSANAQLTQMQQGKLPPLGSASSPTSAPVAAPTTVPGGDARGLLQEQLNAYAQAGAAPGRRREDVQRVLDTGRARWGANQSAVDAYEMEQRAAGKRFLKRDDQGRSWSAGAPKYSFEDDRGVAQGNFDYALAKAQKRTPLQDALRQRAMAAYLMGG